MHCIMYLTPNLPAQRMLGRQRRNLETSSQQIATYHCSMKEKSQDNARTLRSASFKCKESEVQIVHLFKSLPSLQPTSYPTNKRLRNT